MIFQLSHYGQWYYTNGKSSGEDYIVLDKNLPPFGFLQGKTPRLCPNLHNMGVIKPEFVDEANLKVRSMLTAYYVKNVKNGENVP